MAMTGVWRSTGGINNLDVNYMQTVINNVRNRLAANRAVRAQDIQDVAWLYNTWIQHTHDYWDHEYEAYGNKAPVTYTEVRDTRYDGSSNYVSLNSGYSQWVWNGEWVGYYQPGLTPPPGFELGAFVTSTNHWENGITNYYQITGVYTSITRYYGGSTGYSKSTAAINGLDYFDYSSYFAAGNKLTAWVMQDLANLVNSIRSHTHWFDDVWIDRSP